MGRSNTHSLSFFFAVFLVTCASMGTDLSGCDSLFYSDTDFDLELAERIQKIVWPFAPENPIPKMILDPDGYVDFGHMKSRWVKDFYIERSRAHGMSLKEY